MASAIMPKQPSRGNNSWNPGAALAVVVITRKSGGNTFVGR